MFGFKQKGEGEIGAMIFLAILASCLAAWGTHIVVCLTEERWGFLIAGAIMFPIAVIHGFLIWLGIA